MLCNLPAFSLRLRLYEHKQKLPAVCLYEQKQNLPATGFKAVRSLAGVDFVRGPRDLNALLFIAAQTDREGVATVKKLMVETIVIQVAQLPLQDAVHPNYQLSGSGSGFMSRSKSCLQCVSMSRSKTYRLLASRL